MMKDILFFNYSWVPNSTYIFESFVNCGYDCDFVTELNLSEFTPICEYKVVIAYLHEPDHIPYINDLLCGPLKNSYLIQHDDTDEEQIQDWYLRKPHLIMQREVTKDTKNSGAAHLIPFHFPIPSLFNPNGPKKNIDVAFIGTPSNPKREFFIEKLKKLKNGSLRHLNWALIYEQQKDPTLYASIINSTKIGLNYPGNSYDSWRNWELASVGAAILQPELKSSSTNRGKQIFQEYIRFDIDCNDLEDKIAWTLDADRWKLWGKLAKDSYDSSHTPEKCFESYIQSVLRFSPLEKRPIKSMSAEPFFLRWRQSPV